MTGRPALWAALAAVALLWPSRVVGVLDGVPLDGRAEAVAIGLVAPALWWLDRQVFNRRAACVLILALLAWKTGGAVAITQQGLCAYSSANVPLNGINQGIPIFEPSGVLRSWDVRADWRGKQPECTAILTRPLPTLNAFPAWFLNVTDPIVGRGALTMSVRGAVTIAEPRSLTFGLAPGQSLTGLVDQTTVTGGPIALAAGTHAIDLRMDLSGSERRFEPQLDGRPMADMALVTIAPPGQLDRVLAPWAWLVTPTLVLALLGVALAAATRSLRARAPQLLTVSGMTMAAVALALLPDPRWHRAAGLVGIAALVVPWPSHLRNLRGAFLLVGVPWLAFLAVWSLPQVGQFSVYSPDDWLTYQVAGYRIFMHGYWLEGGNAVFDFQPFYRWMTGALHLLFGDSSVGEVYWDGTCLLIGALLAFYVVRSAAGFRWGLAAAIATLATLTLATPWYFLGRGLSEIAAAGWAFLAMFCLLRGRRGHAGWVATAALLAVLMFYTRLNHLLFAAFLPAFLLPLRVPATLSRLRSAVARLRWKRVAGYATIFSCGVVLFMTRTWYYTGVFSLFYGTSLRHNDTGLRPWTLFEGEVWSKVGHSLLATIFMNEPPRPDPRAILMLAGAIVLLAVLAQLPLGRRVPAVLVIAAVGGSVGALLAHAHGYPGRFSIHLIPLVCALAMVGAAQVARRAGL